MVNELAKKDSFTIINKENILPLKFNAHYIAYT